jgi:hypothetical protein
MARVGGGLTASFSGTATTSLRFSPGRRLVQGYLVLYIQYTCSLPHQKSDQNRDAAVTGGDERGGAHEGEDVDGEQHEAVQLRLPRRGVRLFPNLFAALFPALVLWKEPSF